jgi:hypothetical protein
MNVQTGEIIPMDAVPFRPDRDAFQPVPHRFQRQATAAMASGGYVQPGTALSAWAEKRKTKERRRRKLAKASRRRNRR